MSKTVKTVTEIEYDEKGRVVKETKTVTETPVYQSGSVWPSTWPTFNGYGTYQRPSVMHSSHTLAKGLTTEP